MDEKTLVGKIQNWLKRFASLLPEDEERDAWQLFEHDEWEMAFERLLIALMESTESISIADLDELEQIAVACKLKRDGGIADYYVFQNFERWKRNQTSK